MGDTEDGFQQSDQEITGEYSTGYQEHFYLEPWSCLVVPRGENEEMDIIVTTQNLNIIQVQFQNQKYTEHLKNRPQDRIGKYPATVHLAKIYLIGSDHWAQFRQSSDKLRNKS